MAEELKALSGHVDRLKALRAQLLEKWVGIPAVRDRLEDHGIGAEFFSRYFGMKVIDYALGVIAKEERLGNCPVIGVMLVLFKKKNIPLHDVFMICVNLKNTLQGLLLENGLLDSALLEESALLMDRNFEGVIKEYVELYYLADTTPQVCTLPTQSPKVKDAIALEKASLSEANVMSAAEFSEDVEIDHELIDELNELENEVLAQIELHETIDDTMSQHIVALFVQYSRTLNMMLEFDELAYTINVLTDLLRKYDPSSVDTDVSISITIYLKAIISDLRQWKESVLIEQSAEDIHYLDKTLLSSIAQLEIMLMPADDEEEEDIEFF